MKHAGYELFGTECDDAGPDRFLERRGSTFERDGCRGSVASNDPQTIEQVQQSVKDVKVDMDGDLVKAYVIFGFHGQDLSLGLDGHLGAETAISSSIRWREAGIDAAAAVNAGGSGEQDDVVA